MERTTVFNSGRLKYQQQQPARHKTALFVSNDNAIKISLCIPYSCKVGRLYLMKIYSRDFESPVDGCIRV